MQGLMEDNPKENTPLSMVASFAGKACGRKPVVCTIRGFHRRAAAAPARQAHSPGDRRCDQKPTPLQASPVVAVAPALAGYPWD